MNLYPSSYIYNSTIFILSLLVCFFLSFYFLQKFENMRVLDITQCSVKHIGNISGLSDLEEISISNWKNLTTIDYSMGLLNKLKILYVGKCKKLKSFPPLMLGSLEKLVFDDCENLKRVKFMNGSLGKLKILKFISCPMLKSIPSQMLHLLEILDLSCMDFWVNLKG